MLQTLSIRRRKDVSLHRGSQLWLSTISFDEYEASNTELGDDELINTTRELEPQGVDPKKGWGFRGVHKAIICGKIGNAPVQKILRNGRTVTIFTVGTGGMYDQRITVAQNLPKPAQWHRVVVHNEVLGAYAVQQLAKKYGVLHSFSPVFVEGDIETRVYNDTINGQIKNIPEICVRRDGDDKEKNSDSQPKEDDRSSPAASSSPALSVCKPLGRVPSKKQQHTTKYTTNLPAAVVHVDLDENVLVDILLRLPTKPLFKFIRQLLHLKILLLQTHLLHSCPPTKIFASSIAVMGCFCAPQNASGTIGKLATSATHLPGNGSRSPIPKAHIARRSAITALAFKSPVSLHCKVFHFFNPSNKRDDDRHICDEVLSSRTGE
ncbi:hypothetical protein ACLOJK_009460 [Asimina triloba]